MRPRSRRFSSTLLPRLLVLGTAALGALFSCSDSEDPASGAGGGGTGGGVIGPGEKPARALAPGEVCDNENSNPTLLFSTPELVLATGKSRSLSLTIQPDICQRTPITLTIDSGETAVLGALGGGAPVADAKGPSGVVKVDLDNAKIPIELRAVKPGATKLTATITLGDKTVTASIPIRVADAKVPTCAGQAMGQVTPGGIIGGTAAVGGAELGLQAGSDMAAQATEDGMTYAPSTIWTVQAFAGTVGCTADIVPTGFSALGPAVTFGPEATVFPREIPLAIPIEPALIPEKAKLRHVRVSYSGPGFKTPRTIPIADPTIEVSPSGGHVLRFLAPRLGTYQAVIAPDAGTHIIKRRITHRAIIGISMGGGGTATFGTRHHDKFDVLAPLGGPVDWTYMMNHIEHNHVGGFSPNDGETQPPSLPPMPKPRWTYEHASTFNQWWYEYPRNGNGGSFARRDYTQIFRDLSLMYGNPNGQNDIPGAENLPNGVDPTGPAVTGDHPGNLCQVWVESIDGHPNEAQQKELENSCPTERCSHTQVINKFYDGQFNSKGKWPVITVCDGAQQTPSKSPWSNQWQAEGDTSPFEVGLAVDYNNNGKRDEDEPIIRQGHEPWKDVGADGLASADEPGYMAGVNDDPAGDDYDPQYNPTGTEGDGRFQDGEPYDDVGLDGVANTKDSPFDHGEGDGKFSVAKGLQNFFDQDPHSIVRQWSTPPAGALDDAALHRLDLWSDGGFRDLFNFSVAAQHLVGAFTARGRDAFYYSRLDKLPGQDPNDKYNFLPQKMYWDDLPGVVLARYGYIDPTSQDLVEGAGQHVGTANEITHRLQGALYYISSRWPDAPHTLVEKSADDPAPGAESCEVSGNCAFTFKDSRGREGPVSVSLPPGYAHKNQTTQRYPVIFMLHGYGQNPQDLSAAILFLSNWMNQGLDSSATRMAKAILVYVDGRCRTGPTGEAECIRGTFYADSPRPTGGKLESWFLELMTEIDKKYRTMGETEIDWPE
jgi:hypothetical protein